MVEKYRASFLDERVPTKEAGERWPELYVGYTERLGLGAFPEFIKAAARRLPPDAMHTPGMDGWELEGAGSVRLWFLHATKDAEMAVHKGLARRSARA